MVDDSHDNKNLTKFVLERSKIKVTGFIKLKYKMQNN